MHSSVSPSFLTPSNPPSGGLYAARAAEVSVGICQQRKLAKNSRNLRRSPADPEISQQLLWKEAARLQRQQYEDGVRIAWNLECPGRHHQVVVAQPRGQAFQGQQRNTKTTPPYIGSPPFPFLGSGFSCRSNQVHLNHNMLSGYQAKVL